MNWYEIEAKMRKVIHQLLRPIVDRTFKDRERIESSEKHIMFHRNRLQSLTVFINKEDEFDQEDELFADKLIAAKRISKPYYISTKLHLTTI